MILKSSFLADCWENFKRRSWVFWLQMLSFFCIYPGAALIILNSMKTDYQDPVYRMERMTNFTVTLADANILVSILIVFLAVMAGLQSFSWLHDKKQVNFYHSQPVRRNRRFLITWVNGSVSFLISYLVNLVLMLLVAASFGALTPQLFVLLPKAVLAHLLLFLAIYHVAMAAVLMTGHLLVSLAGTAVLLVFEVAARGVVYLYMDSFFRTYGNDEAEKIVHTLFSPLVTFFRWEVERYEGYYPLRAGFPYGQMCLEMLLLILLFGGISWLLYRKRASESHGKSMAFSFLQEPIKLMILVVGGLFGGLFIFLLSGSSVVMGLSGAAFTVVLGHIVIQIIYEVDFRGIRKGLGSLLIGLAASLSLFAIFRWDLLGYDDRIPSRSRVESVSLNLEIRNSGTNRLLPDGTAVNNTRYWKNKMCITDLDPVYALLDTRVSFEDMQASNSEFAWYGAPVQQVEFVFHMKNGKTVNRTFFLDYPGNMDTLNQIFQLREYQTALNQLMEDNFVENYRIFYGEYHNGTMDYKIPDEILMKVMEAYKEDVSNTEVAQLCAQLPVGRLQVHGRGIRNIEYINEWGVSIYPDYTKTLDLLKDVGIPIRAYTDTEDVDEIRKIRIIYTDTDAMEADGAVHDSEYRMMIDLVPEGGKTEEANPDYASHLQYEATPEQMKEFLNQCVDYDHTYWMGFPVYGRNQMPDRKYDVIIELEDALDVDHIRKEKVGIREGRMPRFVQELIAEQLNKQ